MRIYLMYRAAIKHIAAMEGITPEDRDILARIAERSIAGCSWIDAVRVARIVYRLLRPARANR
jgi:hypothetical protein